MTWSVRCEDVYVVEDWCAALGGGQAAPYYLYSGSVPKTFIAFSLHSLPPTEGVVVSSYD